MSIVISPELCSKRIPRPNTKYIKVFNALRTGVERRDLPVATGLSGHDVSNTIYKLRRDNYLPKSTKEEEKRVRSESTSLALGGLSIEIFIYAEMGMSPREIKFALDRVSLGEKFSTKQIKDALGKGRMRGKLPRLTLGELQDIHKDIKRTDEELRQTVDVWCRLRRIIDSSGSEVPQGRIGWKKAISRYKLIKEISGWADYEDEKGLFAYRNGDGKKYRRMVSDEDGLIVCENFNLAGKRWESRQRNGNGKKEGTVLL